MEFRQFISQSGDCRVEGPEPVAVFEQETKPGRIPQMVRDEENGKNRILYFPRLADVPARVAANTFGDVGRIHAALGVKDAAELTSKINAALREPPQLNRQTVDFADYQKIENPDLRQLLPRMTYSRDDVGPYLTSAIALTRTPATGRYHVCFVRMQHLGENRVLFNAATPTIRKTVAATVGAGQELDVVILIGPPIEIIMMACMSFPGGPDKLALAQAIARDGLTFSNGAFPLPAKSEYILKAKVLPEFQQEGPFGDILGLYSAKAEVPVCRIESALVRQNPVYHSISAGISREHAALLSMGAAHYLERIKTDFPGLQRYQLPFFGGSRLALLSVEPGTMIDEMIPRLWKVPIVRMFVFIGADVECSAGDLLWAIIHRAKSEDDFSFSDTTHPVFKEKKLVIDATANDPASWNSKRVAVYRES